MTSAFILQILITYKYWMFVPLALLVGGPVVALLAGLLTALGYLEIIPTYLMLLLCDLIPDTIYYLLGSRTNARAFLEKYGHTIGLGPKSVSRIDTLWKKHTFKSMIVSKWAYGFSLPLLMSAGVVRLPFYRYLIYTLSITMAQYVILFAIGYYSGESYEVLIGRIHYVEYVVAGVLIAVIIGYAVFSFVLRRRFLRDQLKAKSV